MIHILFQFHYKQEGSYSVGSIGMVDVDCDFVNFTYVRNKRFFFVPNILKFFSLGSSKAIGQMSKSYLFLLFKWNSEIFQSKYTVPNT